MKHALYALLGIAAIGLNAFSQQLAGGAVPIPDGWEWLVPIALPMLAALSAGPLAVSAFMHPVGK